MAARLNRSTRQYLFLLFGCISLGLAAVGIFLPVLPTTPFLLMAAYCFLKSSNRMYQWLMHHPVFGRYLFSYMQFHAIEPRVKKQALITLWVGLLLSALIVDNNWVRLFLLIIGAILSVHIHGLKQLTEAQLRELDALEEPSGSDPAES